MSERGFMQSEGFRQLVEQAGLEPKMYGSNGYHNHIWHYTDGRSPTEGRSHVESMEALLADQRFIGLIAQAIIQMSEADAFAFLAIHPQPIERLIMSYLSSEAKMRYRQAHPEPMYPAGGP